MKTGFFGEALNSSNITRHFVQCTRGGKFLAMPIASFTAAVTQNLEVCIGKAALGTDVGR